MVKKKSKKKIEKIIYERITNPNNDSTHSVIKARLQDIVKDNKFLGQFNELAIRIHKIYTHVSRFLYSALCWIYDEDCDDTFKISKSTIFNAFSILTQTSQLGRPPSDDNLEYRALNTFFKLIYSKYNFPDKLSGLNCSNIFSLMIVDIYTNIVNNIQGHFKKYVKKYVKTFMHDNLEADAIDENNKIIIGTYHKSVDDMVNDLLLKNNEYISDEKYAEWITNNKQYVCPKLDKSFAYDFKMSPTKFLKYMCIMNKKFGSVENVKKYKFFPLRTEFTPKSFPFDTACLSALFCDGKKREFSQNIIANQEFIWGTVFDLNKRHFRRKGMKFGHHMTTNGYDVSILFVTDDQAKLKAYKTKAKKEIPGLLQAEIMRLENEGQENIKTVDVKKYVCKQHRESNGIIYKDETEKAMLKKKVANRNSILKKLRADEKVKGLKRDKKLSIKNLITENKKLLDLDKKALNVITEYDKQNEYPYVEDLNPKQLGILKSKNLVFCDPGRLRLLTMYGKKVDNDYKYNKSNRIKNNVEWYLKHTKNVNIEYYINKLVKQYMKKYSNKFPFDMIYNYIKSENVDDKFKIAQKMYENQEIEEYSEIDKFKKFKFTQMNDKNKNNKKSKRTLLNVLKLFFCLFDNYDKLLEYLSTNQKYSFIKILYIVALEYKYKKYHDKKISKNLKNNINSSKVDENGYVYIKYTKGRKKVETGGIQRDKEVKRLRNIKLSSEYSDKPISVIEMESELANYESKSTDFNTFMKYVTVRNILEDEIYDRYADMRYRKQQWYSYLNKRRGYAKLVDQIKSYYGKEAVLIYGDWSAKSQMRGVESTPGIGLKKRLRQDFEVIHINEFRTSVLCHKTEEVCKNLKIKRDGKSTRVHSILTYRTSNGMGCMNRDKNAVLNMKKVYEYMIEHNMERPEKYRRSYKLDQRRAVAVIRPIDQVLNT